MIEIKESAVEDQVRLVEAVRNYRSLGYQIAVDDFGATQSSIDRILNNGAQVVIEGIENAKQLEIAHNTGANLLQGYHLGRPEFAVNKRGSLCRTERLAA